MQVLNAVEGRLAGGVEGAGRQAAGLEGRRARVRVGCDACWRGSGALQAPKRRPSCPQPACRTPTALHPSHRHTLWKPKRCGAPGCSCSSAARPVRHISSTAWERVRGMGGRAALCQHSKSCLNSSSTSSGTCSSGSSSSVPPTHPARDQHGRASALQNDGCVSEAPPAHGCMARVMGSAAARAAAGHMPEVGRSRAAGCMHGRRRVRVPKAHGGSAHLQVHSRCRALVVKNYQALRLRAARVAGRAAGSSAAQRQRGRRRRLVKPQMPCRRAA